MKNIKHFIVLMAAIFTLGTVHAESFNTQRRSKDPWRIMQTVLYNHFIDTTGLSIITPIDDNLLYEITPDLSKAFQVKERVDLSQANTLGDVICAYMQVKYAGRTGQTYDYYKFRYSHSLVHDKYLERYPDSPYATEMRLKGECLKQYSAWLNCYDVNDYLDVLLKYKSSNCPYGGFVSIASTNNELREQATYYVRNACSHANDSYFSGNDYNYDFDYDYNYNNDYDYNYNNDYGYDYNYDFELGNPFYSLDGESDDDNTVANLLIPNSLIGHSALCLGNRGKDASITVSFDGPSAQSVVLDHGQYKWIDLENGKYEVSVTSSNGNVWTPSGKNSVAVENGVYMASWCDCNGMLFLTNRYTDDYLDKEANGKMAYSVVKRAIKELSELSELDRVIQKGLLMHYMQELLDPYEQEQEEMEELYDELTDDNIDLLIDTFKYWFELLRDEYNSVYQTEKTYTL